MPPAPTNLRDTATTLGIAPRTLERWIGRGAPKASRGRFDAETVKAWAQSAGLWGRARGRRPEAVVLAGNASGAATPAPTRDGPKQAGAASRLTGSAPPRGLTPGEAAPATDPMSDALASSIDLAVEKARKERALASLAEIRLAKEKGRLLDAREVEKGRVARVMYLKAKLSSWPARLSPVLVGKSAAESFKVIEDAVRELLEEMSRG